MDNVKKIYIEFNGVAGSGKTTISRQLCKIFELENIPVSSFQNLFYTFVSDSLWKLKVIRFLFKLDGLKLLWNTIQIVRVLKIPAYKLRFVPYMILTQLLLVLFLKKEKIIISDEGIIQYLVSILFEKKINSPKFSYYLNNIFKIISSDSQIILVNVNLDSSQIYKRLSQRRNGCSRLDDISQQKKRRIINTQKENFKVIHKCMQDIPHININAEKNSEDNACLIFKKLVYKFGVCHIEKYYK